MQETNNSDLAEQPVAKLLPRFAVPCVLSMLVSALYNMVEQIFIGQSVGYLGNAATNVVYPFTVIALALALLVGDGCAAQLSLSLGSGDTEHAHKCVGHGIVLTGTVGILLMIVGRIFTDPILRLFGVTQASYPYAREYMHIILPGIPFYVFSSGMNATIRADGAPGYSMAATILGAVINLILDPVAIFRLDMGVKGAAIATILGQIASCSMTALYFRRPKSVRFCASSFRLEGGLTRKLCQLGVSSFITQMAIVIIISVANNMIVLTGPASRYGADIPLSVIGIVMKVFGIVVVFSVHRLNYGVDDYRRAFAACQLVVRANIAVGGIAMLIFERYPQAVIALFGSESALYNEFAELCFHIFLGGILLTCIQKASSIFLQAIGKPAKAAILSLSRDVTGCDFFGAWHRDPVPGVWRYRDALGCAGCRRACIRTDRDTGRAGMAFHPHPGEPAGAIDAGNKTASGVWNAGCVSGR